MEAEHLTAELVGIGDDENEIKGRSLLALVIDISLEDKTIYSYRTFGTNGYNLFFHLLFSRMTLLLGPTRNAMLRGNSGGQRKCVTTGLRATQLHGQLESMDWSRKMGAVKSLFIKKIFSTVHLQALPISMVVSRLPVFYKQKGLSTLLGIFLTYVIGFEHMFEDIIKKNGGYGALDITNESYDDMDRRLKHKKR
ncbi:hypothetical protein D0Y65_026032, partial [Glycine soja]